MASKLIEILEILKAAKDANSSGGFKTTAILIVVLLTSGGYYAHENILHPIMDKVYAVDTYDFYRYVEFDLMKQGEKLAKDPADMKQTDLLKFQYYCNSYFGEKFKLELEADRQIVITKLCKIVDSEYNKIKD